MKLFFILFSISLSIDVVCQDGFTCSGGSVVSKGGNASYSVGQTFYTSTERSEGSVSAGVQHTYEIIVSVEIEDSNFCLKANAYPNPVSDFLILTVNDFKEAYMYQIVDINGKQIANGQLCAMGVQLDFSKYTLGSYYVHIISIKKEKMKTFKVIKKG